MTERLVEEMMIDHLYFFISEISFIADLPQGVKLGQFNTFQKTFLTILFQDFDWCAVLELKLKLKWLTTMMKAETKTRQSYENGH